MEDAGLTGKAKRVRIYVNEGDLHGRQPSNAAILTFLRKEGASGATVFRAIEGFGGSGEIHTARLVDIAGLVSFEELGAWGAGMSIRTLFRGNPT